MLDNRCKSLTLALPLVLAAALLGVSAVGEARPPVVQDQWVDRRAPERSASALRTTMVAHHNAARARVGAAPLAWDDSLAADARAYAQQMARTGRFAHAVQRGWVKQGENLWMGTRGAYRFPEMVGSWVAERRYFRRGVLPNVSTTGRIGDVGHYTQIIWRTTTRVGCAMAANARNEYLVCRYSPAGNIIGRDPMKG